MQIDRILGNVGVLYVGAYNSSIQYEYLNCVTYNGSSYVCVNQNGVTGVTPGTTNDWQLSAQKGDTGPAGVVDTSNFYTKNEIDTKIGNIETLLASI